MSGAGKIIDKLTRAYPCTARGCGNGHAAMTLAPKSLPDESFIYQCDTCGCRWFQDGAPIASYHYEEATDDNA